MDNCCVGGHLVSALNGSEQARVVVPGQGGGFAQNSQGVAISEAVEGFQRGVWTAPEFPDRRAYFALSCCSHVSRVAAGVLQPSCECIRRGLQKSSMYLGLTPGLVERRGCSSIRGLTRIYADPECWDWWPHY